jgi:ligand-binding sensor domain-containing protein
MIDYEAHHAQVIDDSAIKGEHIQALCMTDDGTLFLGTQNNGLMRYNAASNKMERVPYSGTNPSNNVFCLANVEGKLLVGTDGQGIKVYNSSTKTMEDYVNAHAPLNREQSLGRLVPEGCRAHTQSRQRVYLLWTSYRPRESDW